MVKSLARRRPGVPVCCYQYFLAQLLTMEICAVVDINDTFSPVAAAASGIDFDRLLVDSLWRQSRTWFLKQQIFYYTPVDLDW